MPDPSKIATKLEQSSRKRRCHEKEDGMRKSKERPNAFLKIQVNLALYNKFHGPWVFQGSSLT